MDYRSVLDRLPIAEGAYFDSFDESRKTKCLPDTRVDLLREISSWVHNLDSHAIFWLNGMAGTGKSTISRTVCQTLAAESHLGANFFFKRGEADRGGLKRFFTTLAADLVQRQPTFASRMKEVIDAEPGISGKSPQEQFEKLILGPLSNTAPAAGVINPIVIVVDALDECDRDEDIELIIWLFSRCSQLVCPKVKLFLTSRPELPLRLSFKKIKDGHQDLILHEVPADIIEKDISKYFESELSSIRDNYNLSAPEDLRLPDSWPGDDSMQTLVQMAVPLFIFASTTCLFIADRKYGDPQKQLQRVLFYSTTKGQGSRLDATYLPILDQQTAELSSKEKNEVIEEFRTIIGTIIILADPLSAAALSRILNTERSTISNRLEMLHSVLSIPFSPHAPIKLLHLSFRDFLLDSQNRGKTLLWIDERETHEKMVDRCLCLLDSLKADICGVKAPGTPKEDIASRDNCSPSCT